MSKVYIEYDKDCVVNYIHNMPLDPLVGIAKTKEELLLRGGALVAQAEPIEIPQGFSTILKYNQASDKIYFELVKVNVQEKIDVEDEIKNLKDRLEIAEQENADLLMDSAEKDDKIMSLENDLADIMLEVAILGGN